MNNNFLNEEEIRISKMISEGGPIIADYFVGDHQMDKERIAAKAMVDEGGMGAEMYYDEDEKIANVDIEETENNYQS